MESIDGREGLVRITAASAGTGGLLGLVSLVLVLGGEITQGTSFMESSAAVAAGWIGFVAAAFVSVGLAGLALRHGGQLSRAGQWAVVTLLLSAAVVVGASSTLALVVPALVDRLPELATEPPAAVPATFILGGLAMGISGLVVAVAMRRRQLVPTWLTTLLAVASVVAILPLPSRFFLMGIAVAVILRRQSQNGGDAGGHEADRPLASVRRGR